MPVTVVDSFVEPKELDGRACKIDLTAGAFYLCDAGNGEPLAWCAEFGALRWFGTDHGAILP